MAKNTLRNTLILVGVVVIAGALILGILGDNIAEGMDAIHVTFNEIAMESKFILVFLLGLVGVWGFAESAIGSRSKDIDVRMLMFFFIAIGAIVFIYGSTCTTDDCPYFSTLNTLSADMGVSAGGSNLFLQIIGAFVLIIGLLLILNFGDILKDKLNIKLGGRGK